MNISLRKLIYRTAALFLLTLVLLPSGVSAATLLIGDKISVEADEVIEDDYYVSVGLLGTTAMSGTVKGDMYALGGSVTANGTIDGDFGTITGLAYMHASVTDDVRIVAGEAIIDDHVGGDVFVLAGVLNIRSTASIDGDVIFYGGDAEISGPVGGSIYGTASQLRIDAPVAGDVDVEVASELTLGSKAAIEGNVTLTSDNEVVRAQESFVAGTVTRHDLYESTADEADQLRLFLVPLLVSLFATLTLYLLFKREMVAVVTTILNSPMPTGFLGLAVIAAGPFVSVLLISTVLGMLLGVFGVGVMLILFTLGFVLAIVFTGALLARLLVGKPIISLTWILLGGVVFHSFFYLPLLGFLIPLALIAMSIGGALLTLYRHGR